MDKKVLEMIEEYEEYDDFFGDVSEDRIRSIEKILNFKFPVEYRDFIKNYGSGGICGVEIVGIEGNEGASVVHATQRYRDLGLDDNIVVIQDNGEYIMCMKLGDNNNCVYSWHRGGNELNKRYASFTDFLVDMFQEGIDNY